MTSEKFDKHQLKAIRGALNLKEKITFITGVGGTGKSAILQHIVKQFTIDGIQSIVLAPTNTASKNINGSTIHSFFSLAPVINKMADIEENTLTYNYNRVDTNNIDNNVVAYFDECSMMGAKMRDGIIKKIKPLKIILFGDPEQLPPVMDKKVKWHKYAKKTYLLKTNYRATNIVIKEQLKEWKKTKQVPSSIPKFKKKHFTKDTTIIAYRNQTLSILQKKLLGYIGGKEKDEVMLFAKLGKTYDNGDIVELSEEDTSFKIKKLQKFLIEDDMYCIVGDYKAYKKELNTRHKYAKKLTESLALVYKCDTRGIKNKLNDEDRYEYSEAWINYFDLKNTPYARNKQFITSYKSQGKGFKHVVVDIQDMDNDIEHINVALGRAIEKLQIIGKK